MGSPKDNLPIQLDAGVIAAVDNFTYLGSNITIDSEVANEMGVRLGKTARTFRCLQSSIFENQAFSVRIKRGVYHAVMSDLLYGSETWVVKSPSVIWLEYFQCIRMILGVSSTKQWKERITSRELAGWFGILRKHPLRWLGHTGT